MTSVSESIRLAAGKAARLVRKPSKRIWALTAGTALVLTVMAFAIGQTTGPVEQYAATGNDQIEGNPLSGRGLYVDPASNAARQVAAWQSTRPQQAGTLQRLADQPTAKWLADTDSIDGDTLDNYLRDAADRKRRPVLVVYNITDRDCGLYSSGGAATIGEYRDFIDKLATKIDGKAAAIILEPDAVANLTDDKECYEGKQRDNHFSGLTYAVRILKATDATVYIDAGNSNWIKDTGKLAETLRKVRINEADGFSLNVSNFRTNQESIAYGQEISDQLDGAHFVIDTSRNGNGAYQNPVHAAFGWCNPPGRALGHYPTTDTGEDRVDAFLYIKAPGESDGQDSDPQKCFNGPLAGQWWPEYALGLVERWPKELQP